MLYIVVSFASLAEAVILFPASLFTFRNLYQGSKSTFAYILTAFTFADALSRLATFIYYFFPNLIVKVPDAYAYTIDTKHFFLLSLQPWIFGMRYWWCGLLCSIKVTC
jgi:hypothetical protein